MSDLTDRALDCQLDLIHWHESPRANDYYGHMIDMQREQSIEMGKGPDGGYLDDVTNRHLGERMCNVLGGTLKYAETIAVTDEMCELLEAAAETIPPYELQLTDLPCPRGFAYFNSGIVVNDRRGRHVVIRAITWQPLHVDPGGDETKAVIATPDVDQPHILNSPACGTSVTLWTDPHDPRDHMFEDVPKEDRHYLPVLMYLNHFLWHFDRTHVDLIDTTLDEERGVEAGVIESWLHLSGCVAAFFRIVLEPFIDTSMRVPGRGVRRRRERANVNIPMDGVRVITLRRSRENLPAHVEHDSEEGEWYTYRFWVRGHWRNQWYPSQGRHAPKWIEPFVKGPEHAPLVQHDHVYEWRR